MPHKFKKLLVVALKPEWSFLKQELKIKIFSKEHQLYTMLDSQNIGLIQIGIGPENTLARLRKFFQDFSCDLILNFGSCGALNSDLHSGDLFLTHNISSETSGLATPTSQNSLLEEHLTNCKISYHVGNLFSSHKIISAQSEKISISHNFNCQAVDMEAFTVAKLCEQNKTELLCVKAVFDEFHDDLSAFENLNRPNGDVDGTKLMTNLLKSPKLILKLPDLKAKMNRVNKNLSEIVRWYVKL